MQAADLSSTSKILVLIPTLAYRASNLPVLNSSVVLLAKRHGQLKEAVVKMIDTTMTFLAEIKTKGQDKEWLELLETLRTVTEGKVRSPVIAFTSTDELAPRRSSSPPGGPPSVHYC